VWVEGADEEVNAAEAPYLAIGVEPGGTCHVARFHREWDVM